MPHNYFKKIPITKMRKGDRVFYLTAFGYYHGKQKSFATLEKSNVTPFGCRKGQTLIAIWNPHNHGESPNVFIPKSKIKKVVRGYVKKPKGDYYE